MTKQNKKPALDISKIIAKARQAYDKKESGLAAQLSTGSSIARPSKDEDFILWRTNDAWRSVTGLPGVAKGYVTQISGKPDSGKSSTCQIFMKEAQDQGCLVLLWDTERKFSKKRFEKLGGKPDDVLTVNTSSIISGVKGVAHLIHAAKEVDPNCHVLVVWDSAGASINATEDNEESEDYSKQPGVTAKEISFAIRKLNKLMNQYMNPETGQQTIATLICNQIYQNLGSVGYTEKGGQELYYLSSLILQLSRKADLTRTKNGERYKYGIVTRCKVRKNHMGEDLETISELDLVVSADGIYLAKDVKSHKDIKGWGDAGFDGGDDGGPESTVASPDEDAAE